MPSRMRTSAAALLLLTATTLAGAVELADTVEVGGEQLPLVGHGVRESFFMSLYAVGLYLPEDSSDLSYIRSDDIPKSIRIKVLWDGSMPDIPQSWSDELWPVLPEHDTTTLRRRYRNLNEGDLIRAEYAPGQGTTLYLNGEEIVSEPGATLINGMLDIWLGGTPVSENLKRLLLS